MSECIKIKRVGDTNLVKVEMTISSGKLMVLENALNDRNSLLGQELARMLDRAIKTADHAAIRIVVRP